MFASSVFKRLRWASSGGICWPLRELQPTVNRS